MSGNARDEWDILSFSLPADYYFGCWRRKAESIYLHDDILTDSSKLNEDIFIDPITIWRDQRRLNTLHFQIRDVLLVELN